MIDIELELIKKIPMYFNIYKNLGIEPPLSISLNFFGVDGFFYLNPLGTTIINRRVHLQAVDVLIENYNDNIEKLLRPLFDSLWNAFGFPESPNYDEEGNWRGHPILGY